MTVGVFLNGAVCRSEAAPHEGQGHLRWCNHR